MSSAQGALDTSSKSGRNPGHTGRILAGIVALLIIAALVAWTVTPKPLRGRLIFTIDMGNLTLTSTAVDYRCTTPYGGASSGEFFILYAYVLSNLGDSGVAVTVLLRVGNSFVAEHPYYLAPHQVISDTIGIAMAFNGTCQTLGAGLGMSVSYPG